jgi:hypothetical protein
VIGFGYLQSTQAQAMDEFHGQNFNDRAKAEILSATLQIEISVPVDDSGLKVANGKGLASLVRDGEKTLLVTHNHWGEILQEKASVAFYTLEGSPLITVSGSEFIGRIRYLDAGTLILESAPEWNLQTYSDFEVDPAQVKTGDSVLVAQRGGTGRNEVILVEAQIESITSIRGLPVYEIKGLAGRLVQKGDSGGGVWHDGKLVGNLWYATKTESKRFTLFSVDESDHTKLEASELSFAAVFPAGQSGSFHESISGVGEEAMRAVP